MRNHKRGQNTTSLEAHVRHPTSNLVLYGALCHRVLYGALCHRVAEDLASTDPRPSPTNCSRLQALVPVETSIPQGNEVHVH